MSWMPMPVKPDQLLYPAVSPSWYSAAPKLSRPHKKFFASRNVTVSSTFAFKRKRAAEFTTL